MAIPQHSLKRSFEAVTIGLDKQRTRRREENSYLKLTEREEQFQLPISGYVGGFRTVWGELDLTFSVAFIRAQGQRDSPFDLPHPTFGLFMEVEDPVMVFPHIRKWKFNERFDVVGCTVRVGALASPDEDSFLAWRGTLALTVQGYGAPLDLDYDTGDS